MNLQRTVAVICILSLLLSARAALSQTLHATRRVLVPRGAALKFSLINPLSSSTSKVGDQVPLRLERPFVIDGVRLLEPGTIAEGRVTRVKRAGPKCERGIVEWKVDTIAFGDASKGKIDKVMEVSGGWEPPDKYPSQAIARGRHDTLRLVLVLPELVAESPLLAVAAMGMRGGKGIPRCTGQGRTYVQPANSIIAVAVSKAHHVRY